MESVRLLLLVPAIAVGLTVPHAAAPRALALPRARIAVACAGADAPVMTAEATSEATSAKDEVMSLTLDGLLGASSELSEALLALEKSNPTADPARSKLLNGVWELASAGAAGQGLLDSPTREIALALYATGYSAGSLLQLLGKLPGPLAQVKLEGVVITITAAEAGQPRASSEVRLPSPLSSSTARRARAFSLAACSP